MRTLRRFVLIVLPLSLLVLLAALFFLATENNAAVSTANTATTTDTTRVRSFARRGVDQLLNAKAPTILSVSELDIRSIFALAKHAVRRFSGKVQVTRRGMDATVTYKLPANPWRNYLNIRFGLNPSSSGMAIRSIRVGKLTIPGRVASTSLRYGLNISLGDNTGDQFLSSVSSVRFEQSVIKFRIKPVPDLKPRLQAFSKRLAKVRDDVALLGDPVRIGIYYAKLVALSKENSAEDTVSLAKFVGPLFRLAHSRGGDPVEENRAALLALVIYFGDARFERLTGPVRTGALKGHRPKVSAVRLGGRRDLLLHFTISAGLRIVSDHGVAMAIGEFKELLDAARGGTGFSFVDLAADRAGARFAEVATSEYGAARRLQTVLAASTSEQDFSPAFNGLVEGLSDTAFRKSFGNVNDRRYKAVVHEIDRRILSLRIFQGR